MIQIDMEMPLNCANCPFSRFSGIRRIGIKCVALNRNSRISRTTYFNNQKPKRCPLKEVKGGAGK